MKLTRRDLLAWSGGATAGIMVTPVPWKLLEDVSIWTQNWPGVPQPARGPVEVKRSFCTLCPQGCGIRVRMAGGWAVGVAPNGAALCPLAFAAHQLNWHPRRLRQVLHHGKPSSWTQARAAFRTACASGPLAIIDGRPRRAASAVLQQFAKTHDAGYRVVLTAEERSLLPYTRWMKAPVSALGYDLENARTIISFGVPLLDGWGQPGRFPRIWSENPDLQLIQIEPALSKTANAATRWIQGSTPDMHALRDLALQHPPAVAIALNEDPAVAQLNRDLGAVGARGGIIRRSRNAPAYESADNLPENIQAILLDQTVPWKFASPKRTEVFRFAAWQGEGNQADWLLPAPGFLEELTDIPTAPAAAQETYAIAEALVPPPFEVHTAAELLTELDPDLPPVAEIIRHRCQEIFKTKTLETITEEEKLWTAAPRNPAPSIQHPEPAAAHHPQPAQASPAPSTQHRAPLPRRYATLIDLDRCTGCRACMIACAAENNVPPLPQATPRTDITPMLVHRVENGLEGDARREVFIPIACMHCERETPCISVCPQHAVELDKPTGIVMQMPQRCLGCRYCMTACPYHARYFNWWDPAWPPGMEHSLNPGVSVRMRGVVEKCNLCHGRLHAAQEKAAAAGRRDIDPADYVPACVEACPTGAIQFGNLADPNDPVSKAARSPDAFRFLARLGTEPKTYYKSKRAWVRALAERNPNGREVQHG